MSITAHLPRGITAESLLRAAGSVKANWGMPFFPAPQSGGSHQPKQAMVADLPGATPSLAGATGPILPVELQPFSCSKLAHAGAFRPFYLPGGVLLAPQPFYGPKERYKQAVVLPGVRAVPPQQVPQQISQPGMMPQTAPHAAPQAAATGNQAHAATPLAQPSSHARAASPSILGPQPRLTATPPSGLDAPHDSKATALPGTPGHAATNTIDRNGGLDPQGLTVDGNNAAGVPKGFKVAALLGAELWRDSHKTRHSPEVALQGLLSRIKRATAPTLSDDLYKTRHSPETALQAALRRIKRSTANPPPPIDLSKLEPGEYCVHCQAVHEKRDDGWCNRCGEWHDGERQKVAQQPIPRLPSVLQKVQGDNLRDQFRYRTQRLPSGMQKVQGDILREQFRDPTPESAVTSGWNYTEKSREDWLQRPETARHQRIESLLRGLTPLPGQNYAAPATLPAAKQPIDPASTAIRRPLPAAPAPIEPNLLGQPQPRTLRQTIQPFYGSQAKLDAAVAAAQARQADRVPGTMLDAFPKWPAENVDRDVPTLYLRDRYADIGTRGSYTPEGVDAGVDHATIYVNENREPGPGVLAHELTHALPGTAVERGKSFPLASLVGTYDPAYRDHMMYATTPAELDPRLAEVKRLYTHQSGEAVNTVESARRALEFARSLHQEADKPSEAAQRLQKTVEPPVLDWIDSDERLRELAIRRMLELVQGPQRPGAQSIRSAS